MVRNIDVDPAFVRVTFCRSDRSGNIFSIIAKAFFILDYEHRYAEKMEMVRRVIVCDLYDSALDIIGEYVELEEVFD